MSWVAVAIGGSAVLSGILGRNASRRSSSSLESGSEASAQAMLENTRMQLAELARQFDYQMRILRPQIRQQYNAQGARRG